MESSQPVELAYIPSLLIQNPLPIRDPKKSIFSREAGGQTLTLTSASGIPFGHNGRMCLALAVTDAVRSKTPRVEMGSVSEWMRRLEVGADGRSIDHVRDQFRRIHGLYINWNSKKQGKEKSLNLPVSSHMELWWTRKEIEASVPTLFDNYLMFHHDFMGYLLKHSVPADLSVYSKYQAPGAQDIYAWLAWKMNNLEKPLELSWAALEPQFSDKPQANPREWRKRWLTNLLEVITDGYPGAVVKGTDTGICLYPSARAIKSRSPGFLV